MICSATIGRLVSVTLGKGWSLSLAHGAPGYLEERTCTCNTAHKINHISVYVMPYYTCMCTMGLGGAAEGGELIIEYPTTQAMIASQNILVKLCPFLSIHGSQEHKYH